MKKILIYGGIAILLLALAVAYCAHMFLWQPVKLTKSEIIDIRPKTTMAYMAARLQERGLIPNALALRIYARFTGKAGQLKTGEYEITSGLRPVDVLDILISGRARVYRLTIPEGKWATEVEGYLKPNWPEAARLFSAQVAQPKAWRRQVNFPLVGNSLEGYLFPDTYRFPCETSVNTIVKTMLNRFEGTCWREYQAHRPRDGRTLRDVLILASLVEAEAKVPAERPTIAGVYINRLHKRMPLQCDATVLYAHGERLKRVLFRDLEIDSPYNTYRVRGLPPGPICNPGLDSFKAALQPARVSYLYYVARGNGTHEFSNTIAEHEAAIRRIRGN